MNSSRPKNIKHFYFLFYIKRNQIIEFQKYNMYENFHRKNSSAQLEPRRKRKTKFSTRATLIFRISAHAPKVQRRRRARTFATSDYRQTQMKFAIRICESQKYVPACETLVRSIVFELNFFPLYAGCVRAIEFSRIAHLNFGRFRIHFDHVFDNDFFLFFLIRGY